MAIWDHIIPEEEKNRFHSGGMGLILNGFGNKPALLIIDMSYAFVDSSFPLGDSSVGWPAVRNIRSLLDLARKNGIPVFYSTYRWPSNPIERGLWKLTEETNNAMMNPKALEIVAELKPLPCEPVVIKTAPSAFHGTNLLNMLIQSNIDTLILTGMVTSGCVQATAVDGFSYGFRVTIPEEAVADRSRIAHKVSLFNFHMKYGDVLAIAAVKEYFSDLSK